MIPGEIRVSTFRLEEYNFEVSHIMYAKFKLWNLIYKQTYSGETFTTFSICSIISRTVK